MQILRETLADESWRDEEEEEVGAGCQEEEEERVQKGRSSIGTATAGEIECGEEDVELHLLLKMRHTYIKHWTVGFHFGVAMYFGT